MVSIGLVVFLVMFAVSITYPNALISKFVKKRVKMVLKDPCRLHYHFEEKPNLNQII